MSLKAIAKYQRRLVTWSLGQHAGWVTTMEVVALAVLRVQKSDIDDEWIFGLTLHRAAEYLANLHRAHECGRMVELSQVGVVRWLATGPSGDMPVPAIAPMRTIPHYAPMRHPPKDMHEVQVAKRGRELEQEAAFGREAGEMIAKVHRHIVDARAAPASAQEHLEAMQAEIEGLDAHWRRRVAA